MEFMWRVDTPFRANGPTVLGGIIDSTHDIFYPTQDQQIKMVNSCVSWTIKYKDW